MRYISVAVCASKVGHHNVNCTVWPDNSQAFFQSFLRILQVFDNMIQIYGIKGIIFKRIGEIIEMMDDINIRMSYDIQAYTSRYFKCSAT